MVRNSYVSLRENYSNFIESAEALNFPRNIENIKNGLRQYFDCNFPNKDLTENNWKIIFNRLYLEGKLILDRKQ